MFVCFARLRRKRLLQSHGKRGVLILFLWQSMDLFHTKRTRCMCIYFSQHMQYLEDMRMGFLFFFYHFFAYGL